MGNGGNFTVREVYKAVRREVANNRSLNIDPSNGYMYLEDLASDEKSNEETTVYRRLNKFSDLAGNVTDFNGAVKFETVDSTSVIDYDIMIEKLELTARQAQVLQLRMGGIWLRCHRYIFRSKRRECYKRIKNDTIKSELKN